jgi:23S rRNA (guanosine2251-2'-O)-methyltransferase
VIAGRNAVVEALRSGVPATSLWVASGIDRDPRLAEALRWANRLGVAVTERARSELDRVAATHQGVVLVVADYEYAHPMDLVAGASRRLRLVGCDGVTDPRNLGAIVRSVAGFGGHGVVVPGRRAAGVTPAAWKASAGMLARVPVARAPNLARTLRDYAEAGLAVIGLDAAAPTEVSAAADPAEPVVLVVGGEGRGLSRLVAQQCAVLARIPLAPGVESLNVAVAVGVALYALRADRGSDRMPD